MEEKPKTGQEVVDEFFSEIERIEGVDKEVGDILTALYNDGKLTNINITNELSKAREAKLNEN